MLKPVEKPIKFIKNLSTKGKSYPITHVSAVIDDNGESVKSTIDSLKNKASLTKVTWLELKNKRDAGKLIPGSLYRITDYQCTTTQENTRSAGHQFDIVLLALSANKLAEEGWAMMNESNVYDVTFLDDVTKKCYLYKRGDSPTGYNIVDVNTLLGIDEALLGDEFTIDEETQTANCTDYNSTDLAEENLTYNYFQNSNLSAWKVWYCLDNDKSRFAWAQVYQESSPTYITRSKSGGSATFDVRQYIRNNEIDFVGVKRNYYGWTCDNINIFTNSETPSNGDSIYNAGESNSEGWKVDSFNTGLPQIDEGKGVIYRLIDEWNNDVGYDFKNIQFVRPCTNGQYDEKGENTWCYTFSINSEDGIIDASMNRIAYSNKIFGDYELSNNVRFGEGSGYIDMFSKSCTILNSYIVLYGTENKVISSDSGIFFDGKKVLTEK